MSKVGDLHEKWSRDPEYRNAHARLSPAFELSRSLIEARTNAKLTQAELAERMKTTQSLTADRHSSVDPVHPGEILREDILPALSMSKTAVADALKISRQTLYDILNEKQPVTAEMAVRFGKLFGNGPNLWINLQRAYDLAIAQRAVDVSGIPTLEVRPR